jgi:hypothetical protein
MAHSILRMQSDAENDAYQRDDPHRLRYRRVRPHDYGQPSEGGTCSKRQLQHQPQHRIRVSNPRGTIIRASAGRRLELCEALNSTAAVCQRAKKPMKINVACRTGLPRQAVDISTIRHSCGDSQPAAGCQSVHPQQGPRLQDLQRGQRRTRLRGVQARRRTHLLEDRLLRPRHAARQRSSCRPLKNRPHADDPARVRMVRLQRREPRSPQAAGFRRCNSAPNNMEKNTMKLQHIELSTLSIGLSPRARESTGVAPLLTECDPTDSRFDGARPHPSPPSRTFPSESQRLRPRWRRVSDTESPWRRG